MIRATLLDYASFYTRLMDSSTGYMDQFRFAISRFEQWAGREIYVDELSERLINDYIAHTRELLSGATRVSRRNMLVRLWRHALTNPALERKPPVLNRDLIGRVKRNTTAPRGWPIPDVQKLLTVAGSLRGKYRGKISKRLYWRAYVLAAWSSGLRRCDLMALRKTDIPESGRICVVQVKTGRHLVGELNPAALSAIKELCAQHGGELIFPLWCLLRCWRKIAKRLIKRAGIGLSIGHLRHSAGTHVENARPGQGPIFLGNTPQVFYKHYYDRTLATDLPQPPPLGAT